MNNFLTDDTKAIILLCGIFEKDRSVNPLSLDEYNALARCLVNMKMRPEDLLKKENIVDLATDAGINIQRLDALLGRGVHLGFAVEEWQRNGIWIISRGDTDYPARYKRHLKDKAPPLLFGVGDRSLLHSGGLAIVGSRNVDNDGELFTRKIAELCALNKMPVISGGARGVDIFAMTAAVNAGGFAIGVLAENLLKKSLERDSRNAIAEGHLLLISPYHPNARFTVGTAMSRNKLIYAMADYGLVVSAEYKKGGTWTGAKEELERDNPLTVFVRIEDNVPLGNKKLMDLGALAWPQQIYNESLKQQLEELAIRNLEKGKQQNVSLFDFQENNKDAEVANKQPTSNELTLSIEKIKHVTVLNPVNSVYEAVLPVLLKQLENPIAIDELSESLNIIKSQLSIWLEKAINEKRVIKLSCPERYQKRKEQQK